MRAKKKLIGRMALWAGALLLLGAVVGLSGVFLDARNDRAYYERHLADERQRVEDSRAYLADLAKRIDQQELVLCASPAYLQRHGAPRTPADLEQHQCLLFRMPSSGRDRPWSFSIDGETVELQPATRLRLGDGEALVDAAIAGLGIAQVPDYMVADAHGAGRVVEVLRDFRPPPIPISVVYPPSRMLPHRVRVLIDALSERGAAKLRIRLG